MKIFPVICGSAFKNKGVQTMMDAVVDYLPSPLDIPPVNGIDPDHPEKSLVRNASDSEPFSALVFKIMTDPYSGQLAFFRVYSGKMNAGECDLQRRQGPQGARRPPDAHARQQARGHQGNPGGRYLRRGGPEDDFHRRHDLRRRYPDHAREDRLPDAGDSARGRAEDQGRSGKDGHGDREAGAGRSHVQGQHRSGNRADDSLRHGRAAPGNHRGPHDARVRRRRPTSASRRWRIARRSATRRKTITRTRSRPAAAVSTRAANCVWSRIRARASSSSTKSRGGNIPKEFIPAIEKGVVEALEGGILAGYPDGGRQGRGVRRRLSRSRFVGNGVQDLRLRSASRKPAARRSRCCSSR